MWFIAVINVDDTRFDYARAYTRTRKGSTKSDNKYIEYISILEVYIYIYMCAYWVTERRDPIRLSPFWFFLLVRLRSMDPWWIKNLISCFVCGVTRYNAEVSRGKNFYFRREGRAGRSVIPFRVLYALFPLPRLVLWLCSCNCRFAATSGPYIYSSSNGSTSTEMS